MKKPLSYKILRIISLLPILFWPFIFYTTIFFFDNPYGRDLAYMQFYSVNSYPLILIANAILSNILYKKNKWISTGLLWWPILFLVFLVIYVFIAV